MIVRDNPLGCGHMLSRGGTVKCLTCGAEPVVEVLPAGATADMFPQTLAAIDRALGWQQPQLSAPSPDSPFANSEPVTARDLDEMYEANDLAQVMADPDIEIRDADAEACRRRLSEFCKLAWKVLHPHERLEWSWHHDALCDHLQWLLEAWMRCQRDPSYIMPYRHMVINLPPGTLKTEILMVFAPAWMWIRWPAWRVLCLSCNPRVALQSAMDSRRIIESPWYRDTFQIKWSLLEDKNAKSDFGTSEGGARQSHGMSATVVGEHAQCILVDDPTDPKKVTRAALEQVNNDWPSLANRVTDERSALRIGIQQRLDRDDWTGYVTKKPGWVQVELPLEFEPDRRCRTPMPVHRGGVLNGRLDLSKVRDDARWLEEMPRDGLVDDVVGKPIGWSDPRIAEGDLLQPERYPPHVLEDLRVDKGPYVWASQYQQRPVPREGGRVKRAWWGWARLNGRAMGDRPRPEGCVGSPGWEGAIPEPLVVPTERDGRPILDVLLLSLDAANKKTARGSLYGLLAVGAMGPRRIVLDDRSARGEIDEIIEQRIKPMIRDWRPQRVIIEGKAAGPTVIRMLKQQLENGELKDAEGKPLVVIVEEYDVDGDKEARLDACIPEIAAGLVYVLEGGLWARDFVEELGLFPNGPTNDRVDALSQALNWLREYMSGGGLYKVKAEDWMRALGALARA